MILTVTPNAAVDKTYRVDDFRLDRVNRPAQTYTVAGGKGVNVARVYRALGGQAVATGFLGGVNGRIVAKALAEEGTADAFVRVAGESRFCIAVIDPQTNTQTEINEAGPEISAADAGKLKRRVERLLSQQAFSCVVLSGSLPPRTPPALYAELIVLARRFDAPIVLDASGDALKLGVGATPWMVKPNRYEMETALGRPICDRAQRIAGARELHARGIAVVAATFGEEGALLVTGQGEWQAKPPPITFASAVASGDAFVAAFLWAWLHGDRPGDAASALRLATGAGAANAAVIGAGFCSREAIYDLAERAEVRPLD